jgi:hypothetical protein
VCLFSRFILARHKLVPTGRKSSNHRPDFCHLYCLTELAETLRGRHKQGRIYQPHPTYLGDHQGEEYYRQHILHQTRNLQIQTNQTYLRTDTTKQEDQKYTLISPQKTLTKIIDYTNYFLKNQTVVVKNILKQKNITLYQTTTKAT